MNLSEVRKLNDGDDVVFVGGFPSLTAGKTYTIRQTGIGAYITDDKGVGVAVASDICLEHYFREFNKKFDQK